MNGLREAFEEIAADVPVYGDLDGAIEQAHRERRRHVAVVAGLSTAAAVSVIVVTGALVVTRDDDGGPPQPIGPATPTERAGDAAEWSGPIRAGTWPIVSPENKRWPDPQDAAFGGVDILETRSGTSRRKDWTLSLRTQPPPASSLDPGTVIEYGLVIDAEEDGDADCHIGINNDTPEAGSYRVWTTNLATGVTEERVRGPYGLPIDFQHPDEEGGSRSMRFFALIGSHTPCDPLFVPASYYAYASITEGGRVTAWDYAPDAAWLEMP